MTPREGVCHEDGQPHRCGRCDRDIIEAHPAATAREESIRAEVIEECARVCEARAAKHHGTFTEDLGESYELGWREDEGKDCAKAIRALALARSTGAES